MKPIAVFLPKSIESVVALDIATTFSGNAYMNLDIKSPSLRGFKNILDLIKPVAVITNKNSCWF